MSWNITCNGKPEEVKQSLQPLFDYAKTSTSTFPTENACVVKVEEICNLIVAEMITAGIVQEVSILGYGSASRDWDKKLNFATTVNLSISWK